MDSKNKPLLSHIVVTRNDNYLGNFTHRLEMMINYICRNVMNTGNIENYELIICDWNSESPLCDALYLSEEALLCTRFVEVSPEVIKRRELDKVSPFNCSLAINVAVHYAQAEMIMFSPADLLLPYQSVKSLFSLLKGETPCPIDIKNCYMGIERFLIPWQLSNRMTLESIDRDLFLYTNSMEMEKIFHGLAGGEGAILISKKIVHEIRCIDERFLYWGGQETQLAERINQFAPTVKATVFGVLAYDLQQSPAVRSKEMTMNAYISAKNSVVNDEHWGLNDDKNIICKKLMSSSCKKPSPPLLSYYFSNAIDQKPLSMTKEDMLKSLPEDYKAFFKQSIESLEGVKIGGVTGKSPFSFKDLDKFTCETAQLPSFMTSLVHVWINSEGNSENTLYLSDFFDKEKLEFYLFNISAKNIIRFKEHWDIHEICAILSLLSMAAALRPTRFLDLYSPHFFPIQTMMLTDPTIIVTTHDPWNDSKIMTSYEPRNNYPEIIQAEVMRHCQAVKYQGYLHNLTGPQDTALERLTKIPLVNEPYEVVFLDLNQWKGFSAHDLATLNSVLATQCGIVVKADMEKWDTLEALEELLEEYNLKIAARLYDVCTFVRK